MRQIPKTAKVLKNRFILFIEELSLPETERETERQREIETMYGKWWQAFKWI